MMPVAEWALEIELWATAGEPFFVKKRKEEKKKEREGGMKSYAWWYTPLTSVFLRQRQVSVRLA